MSKASETAQVEFIKDCLRKGEQRKAILAKFVKKWQSTSQRTFDRRLKAAETDIRGEQSRIQDKAEQEVIKQIDKRKTKILTVLERQELLTQIALGEIEIPTKESRWDPDQKKFVMLPAVEKPGHGDRINAIKELNKIDGAYSPTTVRTDITTGGDKIESPAIANIDLSKLTPEQIRDVIKIKKALKGE